MAFPVAGNWEAWGLAQARHATARDSGPLERSRLGTAQLLRQTRDEKTQPTPCLDAPQSLNFFTLSPSH
jgi:hypothetical protein